MSKYSGRFLSKHLTIFVPACLNTTYFRMMDIVTILSCVFGKFIGHYILHYLAKGFEQKKNATATFTEGNDIIIF